jgi:hypothetical protein
MKKRQIYKPRLLGDQIVTPTDLRRIHKELLNSNASTLCPMKCGR